MKKLIKFLPRKFRENIYRSYVPADNYQERIQGFEIKLATNQAELESAYQLLHDVYSAAGLMDPAISGLRVNIFSTLPYTSVVVAKFEGQVVGTVSLIKDSPIGLPSDKEYLAENNELRKQGLRLVEVSALAVHKSFRKKDRGSMASLLLMRYVADYSYMYMGADNLVCTTHPKAKDFYSALFDFKQNGKVIKYQFVKNALAVHLTAELKEFKNFWNKSHLRNFFTLDEMKNTLRFPKQTKDFVLHPVLTPSMLEYFFLQKTKLFQELSRFELEMIKNAYELHFDMNVIEMFRFIKTRRFGFRYQTALKATLGINDQIVQGQIFDVSPSGLFLNVESNAKIGDKLSVTLRLNDQIYKLETEVIRVNLAQKDYYPKGLGLKLLTALPLQLTEALKNSHLNHKAA